MAEMEALARANFERWNDALQTRDARIVAALYSEDATFLPTVSGEFKRGRAGAEGYFHHFLEKHPAGRVVSDAVQALGPDAFVHSGHYDFVLGPAEARLDRLARFTFIWKRDAAGVWLIAHHHSSMRPQG